MRKYASKKQEILMTIREHLGNTTHYYTTPTEENILELIVNRHGISQNVGKHLIEKSKIELSLINKLPILSDYKSLTNNYPNRIDQHVCTNDSFDTLSTKVERFSVKYATEGSDQALIYSMQHLNLCLLTNHN